MASVIEGASKPLGGDAQETVRPAWINDLTSENQHDDGAVRVVQQPEVMPESSDRSKHGLMRFAREHPALSVLAAAGIGLFGGVEVAAGMLIGAGVVAALRGTGGTKLRERARAFLDRAPPHLRERARAVVQAARGKIAATDEANYVAPTHEARDGSREVTPA